MPRWIVLAALLTAADVDAQAISHQVGLETADHRVAVSSRYPHDGGEMTLMMAVWTPGSYLVREFSRHLEDLTAFDGQGRPLAVSRVSKNRWALDAPAGTVRVDYRVYAREMTVRTSFVDTELALLNPTTLFLVPVDQLDQPHEVALTLPEGWRAYSALPRSGAHFIASDFHQLADSPLVAGRAEVASFQVREVDHFLVHLGDTRFWDLDRAAADVAALTSAQAEFWGGFPYPGPYWLFNLVTEAGGGLEHRQSAVMMAGRWTMRRREDYVDWLGLVSHELFHAWNVKQLRPAALADYDYENENYTRSLWFAEGLTSYYAPLLLVRAGRITPREYFESLAERVRELETRPGRAAHSLAEASFQAWIKFYRPDENTINTTVSYYNKGALVGWLLDVELRRRSDGRHSLDDLMRTMHGRFGETGFSPGDVREVAAELTGEPMDDWFDDFVTGTAPLDYSAALDHFGLELVLEPETEVTPGSPPPDPPRASLDVTTEDVGGRIVVKEVLRGGAGQRAGINAEDEILAIDGVRVLPEEWKDRFAQLRVGQSVSVTVARRGHLMTLDATLSREVADPWEIRPREAIALDQRERLADWLGVDPVPVEEITTP